MAVERLLTEPEIGALLDVIATEGEVAGVVALWSVLLGYPLANHTGAPFDPTSIAIPEAQWRALCGAMMTTTTGEPGFEAALRGGTMMNTGPSAY